MTGPAPEPITVVEASVLIRQTLSIALSPRTVPDGWDGTGFVFVTPATGQRFRIDISEVTA